ncbi:hypothetical protein L596_006428 [Steinernema carpocapsae]|uniref:Uncharacterized protein n=1 Tax=Steinernema carpocapsae TaxID=34508 RepID=A0A4U8V4A6_STECR|nr:hypothetical protein L596_006428 [Steinernema carpocapsae]
MLALYLRRAWLSDEWIDIFSSWKNLNSIEIGNIFCDRVLPLLKNVLRQGSLLQLAVYDIYGYDRELDLFCRFLEQKQFLNLLFNEECEPMIDRIQTENNLERFTGSTITWDFDCTLHNDSFEGLGLVDDDTIQYKKKNLVVSYFNASYFYDDIPKARTVQEFADEVWRSEMRFL